MPCELELSVCVVTVANTFLSSSVALKSGESNLSELSDAYASCECCVYCMAVNRSAEGLMCLHTGSEHSRVSPVSLFSLPSRLLPVWLRETQSICGLFLVLQRNSKQLIKNSLTF
jgi:hypothetical protein